MMILTADKISKIYKLKQGLINKPLELHALQQVSFGLEKGQTLAIVGESGSGKSTVAKILTMIEPQSSGDIFIDGLDVSDKSLKSVSKIREKIQIVFQDPYSSLNPRWKISSILEEPLIVGKKVINKEERHKRVIEMITKVGLRAEHANRYPHMFSGGQRQRIAIARALMLNPEIIILDEAVSALDISIQAQILNLLKNLQKEFNLTYVFISHDLSVVRYISDKIIVLYLGKVIESGDTEDIFNNPQHPYSQNLLASTPSVFKQKKELGRLKGEIPSPLNPPSGCVFHPRCPIAMDVCKQEVPLLKSLKNQISKSKSKKNLNKQMVACLARE